MIYKQSLSYSKDLIKGTKIEIPKKKLVLPFIRGTVNKSETTRTNTDAAGTRHYVIDFPTSAANGTFKSIYWTGGSSTQDTAQSPKINSLYPKAALEAGTSSTSLPNYNLCTDETNLYALIKNATSLVAYDKTTAVKKDNITLSVQAKAIAYDGTNFWILISDSSFKKLNKDFTVISSYPKSAAVPDDLVYDVEYFDIAVNDAYIYNLQWLHRYFRLKFKI
ncbi:hypothetical protein [Clostridium kluyveri]|uniref:Uncharacterized protein n=1 Tax=Clostridium kluyveri TaxID=1534 RepID=A0A1L5FA29_CLOKL|nr:hypothetical protein [Clostridium kluyveri]APM39859.1 hypothetical protein BS101_14525 [Clostridium kluyveri]